ncbi:MAG: hypothetical protein HY556_09795 [Euryarchaeota archaeon]|nr:hypothetical protein [Euryarchaeota archaeon]
MVTFEPLPVRAVLTFLNIGMAAIMLALALPFATDSRAEASLAAIERYPGRFRFGILLSIIGMLIMFPSQVPGLLESPLKELVNIAGYPLIYAGVFMMASATWSPPWPRPRPSEMAEEANE